MRLLAAVLGLFTFPSFAQGPPPPPSRITKASFQNVIKLNAYADNWCIVYFNGKLAPSNSS